MVEVESRDGDIDADDPDLLDCIRPPCGLAFVDIFRSHMRAASESYNYLDHTPSTEPVFVDSDSD